MTYSSGKNTRTPRRRGRPSARERYNMDTSIGPYEALCDIVVNPNADSQEYVYSSHRGDMLSDTLYFELSQWIPDTGRNQSSFNDSHYNAFDNMGQFGSDSHYNIFDNMGQYGSDGRDNIFDNMGQYGSDGRDNIFDNMGQYGSGSMSTADLAYQNSSPSSS